MNLENIVLQGGSLAVVLACFIIVLRWLLSHFTTSLARIEQAQYANTLAMMGVSRLIFRATIKSDEIDNEQLKQMVIETNNHFSSIESVLEKLLSKNE